MNHTQRRLLSQLLDIYQPITKTSLLVFERSPEFTLNPRAIHQGRQTGSTEHGKDFVDTGPGSQIGKNPLPRLPRMPVSVVIFAISMMAAA